jgi:hypothetical protein
MLPKQHVTPEPSATRSSGGSNTAPIRKSRQSSFKRGWVFSTLPSLSNSASAPASDAASPSAHQQIDSEYRERSGAEYGKDVNTGTGKADGSHEKSESLDEIYGATMAQRSKQIHDGAVVDYTQPINADRDVDAGEERLGRKRASMTSGGNTRAAAEAFAQGQAALECGAQSSWSNAD